ncbi:MAG: TetR/AcrR family transcriptional regulator [Pigmentiphaga sp.]|nr:TetR/AcrR family transcriptional regulator [Pigmentiphaga sp.]
MVEKKVKKRGAGRPTGGEGNKHDEIIAAALETLRETHPDGLTVSEVARRAGVDPAMVRYYFTNKEGLLVEAAKFLMEKLLNTASTIVHAEADISVRLTERLKGMMKFLMENPYLHTLLNRVYSSASPDARQMMADVNGRSMMLMAELLRSSEQSVRELDPRFVHCALIGVSEAMLNARPLIEYMFGVETTSPDFVDRYAGAMAELLARGLIRD